MWRTLLLLSILDLLAALGFYVVMDHKVERAFAMRREARIPAIYSEPLRVASDENIGKLRLLQALKERGYREDRL